MENNEKNYMILYANNEQFGYLINALVSAARLNYNGEQLAFDGEIIDTAMRILLPETYAKTLADLRAKEVEKGDF